MRLKCGLNMWAVKFSSRFCVGCPHEVETEWNLSVSTSEARNGSTRLPTGDLALGLQNYETFFKF